MVREGRRPLSPLERRELPYGNATASSWPPGPLAGIANVDLSAYALSTMLAHLVAMLAYVGLSCGQCGPSLGYVGPAWGYVGLSWRLCGPILRPMSADLEAYVGPCWPMLSQRSETWKQQIKHCKTQDILMVGGLSWGYVGPSWGYVGPSWGYGAPSWGYVGRSWAYVGPSWGLCCPILRLCWPILRPMLAHVDPSWATCSEKWEKWP